MQALKRSTLKKAVCFCVAPPSPAEAPRGVVPSAINRQEDQRPLDLLKGAVIQAGCRANAADDVVRMAFHGPHGASRISEQTSVATVATLSPSVCKGSP
jgi:hypothetical protein